MIVPVCFCEGNKRGESGSNDDSTSFFCRIMQVAGYFLYTVCYLRACRNGETGQFHIRDDAASARVNKIPWLCNCCLVRLLYSSPVVVAQYRSKEKQ